MLCFIKGDRIIIEMNVLTCFQGRGTKFIIFRKRFSLGRGEGFILVLEKMMVMFVEFELKLCWRKNSRKKKKIQSFAHI